MKRLCACSESSLACHPHHITPRHNRQHITSQHITSQPITSHQNTSSEPRGSHATRPHARRYTHGLSTGHQHSMRVRACVGRRTSTSSAVTAPDPSHTCLPTTEDHLACVHTLGAAHGERTSVWVEGGNCGKGLDPSLKKSTRVLDVEQSRINPSQAREEESRKREEREGGQEPEGEWTVLCWEKAKVCSV